MGELDITYRGYVKSQEIDPMGHMNVAFYVAKFDEATWQLFFRLGISPSSLRDHSRGMAGLQQDIAYKRELRAGDVVTVRSSILEMKEKTVKFHHEMLNDESGEVAATCTVTAVCFDMQKRKSCAFPVEVLAKGQALAAEADRTARAK